MNLTPLQLEITSLFNKGYGRERIASYSGVSEWEVGKIMRELSLIRPPGLPHIHKTKKNALFYKEMITTFKNIKQRCSNKNKSSYDRYGGRGIKVLWECFDDFYNDMIGEYLRGLTIDRIDNNGNYCKENCRRVDMGVQTRNQSKNRMHYYDGMFMCLKDISIKTGINYGTLRTRIGRGKMTIEQAVKTSIIPNDGTRNGRKKGTTLS